MSYISIEDILDINNLPFYGALLFLFIIFTIILVTFIVMQATNAKKTSELTDASNSLRVYIIDFKNDRVRYFNRSRLQRKKTTSITAFYNHFPANDRIKIIDWIGDLLSEKESTPKYLEINVLYSYNKKSNFSILQVTKVDKENQVIYLESYILKYMYAQKSNNVSVRKFLSVEKFEEALTINHQAKGVTFAVEFFNKRKKGSDISHLMFAQIKNVLVPYITPYRPMLEYGDNKIIICDLKINQKTEILAFVNTLKNEINRLLMISSELNNIGYSFGVAENKYFYNSVSELLNTVVELSGIAKDDGKDMLIYEEGKKITSDSENLHFRTEVERIIQDKKIKYSYRPIYNVEKSRMVGYQAKFEPLDSFFDSIDELKSYAIRTEDDKELFSTIARNSITRFIEQKDGASLRLFFPITFPELDYVNRTFAYISSINEANIVLILNEDELLNLPKESITALVDIIMTFKSKGYEVALLLNDKETALNSTVYEVFDYFLLSVASHVTDRKSQSRQIPSFQALVEKLLRYNKPIIAIDIPSLSLVEYIIKLGVTIVGSDSIAPFDENVLPLNKKILLKLKNMN